MWLFCISTKSSQLAGTVVPWKVSTVGHFNVVGNIELNREDVLAEAPTWVGPIFSFLGPSWKKEISPSWQGMLGCLSENFLWELLSPQDKVFMRKGGKGVTRLYYVEVKTVQGSCLSLSAKQQVGGTWQSEVIEVISFYFQKQFIGVKSFVYPKAYLSMNCNRTEIKFLTFPIHISFLLKKCLLIQ